MDINALRAEVRRDRSVEYREAMSKSVLPEYLQNALTMAREALERSDIDDLLDDSEDGDSLESDIKLLIRACDFGAKFSGSGYNSMLWLRANKYHTGWLVAVHAYKEIYGIDLWEVIKDPRIYPIWIGEDVTYEQFQIILSAYLASRDERYEDYDSSKMLHACNVLSHEFPTFAPLIGQYFEESGSSIKLWKLTEAGISLVNRMCCFSGVEVWNP